MDKIGAVVVSFHPGQGLEAQLQALLPQVAVVVVVDNGSQAEELAGLYRCQQQAPTLRIVELEHNRGLAYAQNQGIRILVEQGCSHVLLLDQDSLPQETMVAQLQQAFARLQAEGHKVAAVGPEPIDDDNARPFFFVRYGLWCNRRLFCPVAAQACCLSVDFLIASGCLIHVSALRDIGLMNEAFFIDQVDTEWCLRARALRYQLFVACDAKMWHRLGDSTIHIRGLEKHVPKHSPLRNYYMFRNTVWMFFQKTTPKRWLVINGQRLLLFLIFFACFVPPRWQRLRMMWRGLVDGLRQRKVAQQGVTRL